MKWVWEKQSRRFHCLHRSPLIREFGDLIWLWSQPQLWSIGRWSLKDGVLVWKCLLTTEVKRRGSSSVRAGARKTRSTCVLLLTNWWYKIILFSVERNGTTWFLMKLKILRTSRVSAGKLCCGLILAGGSYLQAHLCKTTWWSCGRWCTSWCRRFSAASKILRSGSRILLVIV